METLLGTPVPPAPSAAEVRAAVERAWGHLQQRDEAGAVRAVSRLPESSRHVGAVARLARNLKAIKRHRPNLYAQLSGVDPAAATRRFRLRLADDGSLRLELRRGAAAGSSTADPKGAAARTLDKAGADGTLDRPLVVSGVGDGHVVAQLAARWDGAGGRWPVYVVEPDAERVLACLMLHDWSTASGPLRHPAFHWYVADGAAERLEDELVKSDRLELPRVSLGEGPARKVVGRALSRSRARRAALERRWREMIEADYANFEPRALTVGLARKPRALVIGLAEDAAGRPVLEQAAAALNRLGWRTRRITADRDHERVTDYALRRALVEVRPDLVLSFGGGREAYGDVFPAALPVVRWVVDDDEAAVSTPGGRDFALVREGAAGGPGSSGTRAAGREVAVPVSAWVPARPRLWECVGPDVMCLAPALRVTPRAWSGRGDLDPETREAGERLIGWYEAGGAVPMAAALAQWLCDAVGTGDEDARRLTGELGDLHHTLHARQALRWAADAAAELGLGLSIYGEGWEDEPTLAEYARGPLSYGIERERLIRDVKVNLYVEPTGGVGMSRLDGLVAGGFCLARREEPAGLLPRDNETTFDDAASLRRCLARWISDAAGRRALAEAQRESVEHRLSTTAVLRRALARVGRRLAAEARERVEAPEPVEMHRAA